MSKRIINEVGFRITGGKGFHITFPNGYTVSVQFGPGNYADNYDARFGDDDMAGEYQSRTAECAVWPANGDMQDPFDEWGNNVSNRSTVQDVLKLINWAAAQPDSAAQNEEAK